MKTIAIAFVLLTAAMLALTFAPITAYAAIDGDGSSGDPYVVETAQDLADIAAGINGGSQTYRTAHIRLYADLDLSGYANWAAIGNNSGNAFSGTFDGNGHKISGLTVNDAGVSTKGLFGYVNGGTIKNLGLENVNVVGGDYSGGLAANVTDGTITTCYVTGSVRGAGYTGGMIGYLISNSIVKDCYSTVNMNATTGQVGGLVGYMNGGSVSYCYTTGSVSTTGGSAAGIVGIKIGGSIESCVAMNGSVGSSTSTNNRRITYQSPTFNGNFNYGRNNMSGISFSVIGAGLDTAQGLDISEAASKQLSFYQSAINWSNGAWDENVWVLQEGEWPLLKHESLGRFNIDDADITLNPTSFVYNGSPQTPSITIEDDGYILIVNTDYTWAITSVDDIGTSAGTNVGTVAVTITGKASYFGTVTKTYVITKAAGALVDTPELLGILPNTIVINAIAAPSNGQSVEYTIGTAEDMSDIGIWQAGTNFSGLTGEQYYIFARAKETDNYDAGATVWLIVYMNPPVIWVNLPSGEVGIPYSHQMKADKPAEWSLFGGDMPEGLTIEEDGLISGIPETDGKCTFILKAANAAGYNILMVTIRIGYFSPGFIVTITHLPDEMSATILIMYFDETLENQGFSAKGYIFKGLYTDAAMTQIYDAKAAVVSDMRLYAKWEREPTAPTANAGTIIGSMFIVLLVGGVMALLVITRQRRRKTEKERTLRL